MSDNILPSTNELLADARYVLGKEMKRLKGLVQRNVPFDTLETNQLRTYVRTIIEMEQEERSQEQWDKLMRLPEAELTALLAQALGDGTDVDTKKLLALLGGK